MPPIRKRLGDILLEMGALDAQQLRAALGHQQQWGMPLGQAALERKLCTPAQVLRALAAQTGLQLVELDALELSPALASALPLKVAQMARAVPLEVTGTRGEVLVVAVAAPASLQTLDLVRSGSGKARIVPRLAADDAIERAIGRLYLGIAPEPKKEPPVPVPAVVHAREQMFEPPREDAGPAPTAAPGRATPVLLLGWSEQVGAALEGSLREAGVEARTVGENDVHGFGAEDVLITSTLTLETLLGPGERLRSRIIVCGMPDAADMESARALGARIYLVPPFSRERLLDSIQRCRAAPAMGAR